LFWTADNKGQEFVASLRKRLLDLIDKPPLSHLSQLSTLIHTEACNTFTAGFLIFHPRPTLQISFLLELVSQVTNSFLK
jgi:hypothetical protein